MPAWMTGLSREEIQMPLDGDALSLGPLEGRPWCELYSGPREKPIDELMDNAPSGDGTGGLGCDGECAARDSATAIRARHLPEADRHCV